MQNAKIKLLPVRTALRAGTITLYGADGCGWTQKQRAYLDGKGLAYTYVNCEQQTCPSFVTAYPTLEVDGKITTGYKAL